MSEFLKYLIVNYPFVVDAAIEGWCKMLGVQREVNPEIVRNFMLKGLEFGDECKITVSGKKDETLEVIVSHPGMTDSKSVYSGVIKYQGFDRKQPSKINSKTISFDYEGIHISLATPCSGEDYFRMELYQNFEKYKKIEKKYKKTEK